MRLQYLLVLLVIAQFSLAQNLQISFSSQEEDFVIDSIRAENLRTGEFVMLANIDQLILEDVSSAISNSIGSKNILVYPNPSGGKATIEFTSEYGDEYTFSLYNQLGQQLIYEHQYLQIGKTSLGLQVAETGIYFIRISSSQGNHSARFVVTSSGSASDKIQFLGSTNIAKSDGFMKTGQDDPTLSFILGDEIRYTCYSYPWKTIVQDEPQESKETSIPFYPCIDADRNFYSSVVVGEQVWMGENLAYLPFCLPPEHNKQTEEEKCFVNGFNGTDIETAKTSETYKSYGVLYNWNAALNACPDSWHLPTDMEWKELEAYMGMSELNQNRTSLRNSARVGAQLKSTNLWFENGNGSDACGLNLLPGGSMEDNVFKAPGKVFWTFSSSKNVSDYCVTRYIMHNEYGVNRLTAPTSLGGSVRCVMDKALSVRSFDDVIINYEVHGEGEQTLVFIHGWSNNLDTWKWVVERFKDDYQVVAIDLAGFGKSGNNRSDWSMQSFAQDVKAVLDKVMVKNAVLIGHSMGGPVAIEAALLEPNRVNGIVLEDILYGLDYDYSDSDIKQWIDYEMLNAKNISLTMARSYFENYKDLLGQRYFDMVNPALKYGWEESGTSFYYWTTQSSSPISQLACTVHSIIAGSAMVDVASWREHIPDYQVKRVNNTGHTIHWENLDEYCKILQESIDGMFQ